MRPPFPIRSAVGVIAGATVLGLSLAAAADPVLPADLGARTSPEINPPGPVVAHGTGASDTPITPSTPDMKAVQDLLGQAAGDETMPGHGRDLIGLLSRAARDRTGSGNVGDWSDVAAAATAFDNAWQARFGLSFKVSDKIAIVFTEPAVQVIDAQPAPAPPTTIPTTAPAPRKTAVTVVLADPAGHGSVSLHLLNEGTDKPLWRFDLPDTATAATLHDSLLRHLTAVTDAHARWPTDVDQAYVFITRHLLAAIGDAGVVRVTR